MFCLKNQYFNNPSLLEFKTNSSTIVQNVANHTSSNYRPLEIIGSTMSNENGSTHQAFHVTFEFSVSAGSPQHLADEAHVVQGRGPGHVFGLLVQVRRHAQGKLVAELA